MHKILKVQTRWIQSTSERDDPDIGFQESMRRLRDMTSVTRLKATPRLFTGLKLEDYTVPLHECLPPSVCTIYFTDKLCYHEQAEWSGEDDVELVETWLKVKEQWTSKLEEFDLRETEFIH